MAIMAAQRSSDEGKPTLVLDLDDTLIHTLSGNSRRQAMPDFAKVFHFPKIVKTVRIACVKRPWLDFFLEEMATLYEIVIFSAGQKECVDFKVQCLDPSGKFFSRCLTQCTVLSNGDVLKDLTKLGRPLERVIWLDDKAQNFFNTPNNGLQVTKYDGSKCDTQLLDLIPLLKALAKVEDVRPAIYRWKCGDCCIHEGELMVKNWNNDGGFHPFGIDHRDRTITLKLRLMDNMCSHYYTSCPGTSKLMSAPASYKPDVTHTSGFVMPYAQGIAG